MDTELSEWLDGHDRTQPDTVSHDLLSADTGTSSQIPSSVQTTQEALASEDSQPANTPSLPTAPPTAPDSTPSAAGAVNHKRHRLPGDHCRDPARAASDSPVTDQHAASAVPEASTQQPHGSVSHAGLTCGNSCTGSCSGVCSCMIRQAGCVHKSVCCSSSETSPERRARRPVCVDVSSLGSLGLMPDPGFLLRVVHRALRIINRKVR